MTQDPALTKSNHKNKQIMTVEIAEGKFTSTQNDTFTKPYKLYSLRLFYSSGWGGG